VTTRQRNGADALRSDAGLKSFCNRLPESGGDLASGPTLSRMENAAARRDLWRALERLRDQYLLKLNRSGRRRVVWDLDSTDDPTHGQQEFSFYHGYFKSHVYHPLLIFDAQSADLVTALLRAGNRGAAYRVVPVLKRLIPRMRQKIERTAEIEIRADSGFATPEIYEYCEREQLTYVIGFSRNRRLEAAVEELVVEGRQAYEQEGVKQRLFTEFSYQADSWDRARRMVAKVEVTEKGVNRRFVVTNREDLTAQELYDHYTQRGQSENYIKAFKKDLQMDRLSCHRFLANQFRLLLHALAYQLFLALREYLDATPWKHLEIETLRRRVLKIGARIRETTRRIWIQCSSSYPEHETFLRVLQRICARPG